MLETLELNVEDYIKKIYEFGDSKIKVFFGTERNYPTTKARYEIYLEDDVIIAYNWHVFILSIYNYGTDKKQVDFEKTWNSFELYHPLDINRKVIVEYWIEDVIEFNYKEVVKQSKELSAPEFKTWLKRYMKDFPEYNYKHDLRKSVKDILLELKNE